MKIATGIVDDSRGKKTMYPAVIKVVPREDFTLFVIFDNGEEGCLDIKPILDFGVFTKLKDYEVFRSVRVVFDAVGWDCGIDLDPEYIYAKCTRGGEE